MTRSRRKSNTSAFSRKVSPPKHRDIVAEVYTPSYRYFLERTSRGWALLRAVDGDGEVTDFERFPLDHDKRHQRFFLSERDQRYVGIEGLVALEKLARVTLDR